MIGRTLSHYRIEERLGAGGMGEVYRARDEKLGRDVALKVLSAGSLADEEARRRLRKEASVLSRLSHPHVATLHDFDTADGVDFLVMELVVGPTLEQELREGPLPENDVVRLGSQLARGLVTAHEQGVIHRDLKPSNLQLTSDGLLKILDFGVAHLERGGAPTGGEATTTETAAGKVLGSPPYMAPEQLLGKPVDARTDLYAAGACLYELATGKRPYGDRHGPQLTEAILHESPVAPRTATGSLSPGLESVILKALDKDPELRYQTARELLVDLERLGQAAHWGGVNHVVAVAMPRRRRWPWLLAAPALFAAAAAGLLWPLAAPRIVNVRSLTAGLEADIPVAAGVPSWATDGMRLYYLGFSGTEAALFQLPVTGGEPVAIPLPFARRRQIHGYLPEESALLMAGSNLLWESESTKGWPLWIVPVPAGAPSRLGGLEALSAAVSSDGRQLALVQPLRIILARRDGSTIRELGPLPVQPLWIQWAPDGQRLRFTAVGPDGRERWIWEILASGGRPRPLWPGERGRWTRDARYYVFGRRSQPEFRGDIYAVREPRFPWSSPSTPARLTSGPLSFDDAGPSPAGNRLYAWGRIDRGELLRYDTETERFQKYLGGASAYYLDASADGRWVTWVSYPEGALWKGREGGTQRLRLTPPGWRVHLPRWSPDGTSIAFAGTSPAERLLQIFRISADGGEPQLLARHDGQTSLWDPCWLPDGRAIVYSYQTRLGIYRFDLRTREVSMLPGTERMAYPKCSARGDVLAMEKPADGATREPFWARFAGRGNWERIGDLGLAYLNWSPDGQALIGLNVPARRIERWSRRTRRLETVAEVGDIPLVSWVHVPWMGLAADGSPLVVRDRSARDLYALDWEAP